MFDTFPASVSVRLARGTLSVDFGRLCPVLSSAPYRGGWVKSRHWVNHHVGADFREADLQGWIAARLASLGFPPEETTGCLTAARLERYGQGSEMRDGFRARAWVTAGLSNLSAPGLSPVFEVPLPHTINACVIVEAELPNAAWVELVQLVAEVKARVLAGRRTPDGYPATGTSTDTVTIAALPGPPARYAGAVTPVGWCVARAFEQAFRSGLR
ncbi:adenosylcobinamide amidohydrolase [Pelomicrobium sp.]|uniref:adenosylcobinamide amidohydrolase n=1 Tax=Pelomicrobium sp. TaxID=2815319 RepID=UPI002FDCC4D0